jgi:hypothetical protein
MQTIDSQFSTVELRLDQVEGRIDLLEEQVRYQRRSETCLETSSREFRRTTYIAASVDNGSDALTHLTTLILRLDAKLEHLVMSVDGTGGIRLNQQAAA